LKTASHKLLGQYLITDLYGLSARRYEKAFIFGCVEPDYNPLTYLRGSCQARFFKGHNFKNAKPCIMRLIQKLQQRKRWGIREFYLLGKLIHYIADAFTYPHNEFYKNSIIAHLRYEESLHNFLQKKIGMMPGLLQRYIGASAVEYIFLTHQQYSAASTGLLTDVQYIVDTTTMILSMFELGTIAPNR